MVRVAVDAMGGDNAPAEIVKGCLAAVKKESEIQVLLVGKEELIRKELEKKQYSPSEIEQFSGKEDISQLIYIIQKYMGRALTGTDLNTVFFFYDTLGMPADVIEYLFEYCVSNGHKNMRYIEKTAIGWAEQGIQRHLHLQPLQASPRVRLLHR